jgi:LCP family protein required for cell wall assembly
LRNRYVQAGIALALIVVLITGSYAGYIWYEASRIKKINVANLTGSARIGAAKGTENILMVGSTDRCALKVQNPIYGLCSQGVNGVNSDVVMILHLDSNAHRVSILSIPRDTFIPNARKEGANKIDAALYEGPSQLVNAIQQDFGIPIQHYVELNFDTFAGVVDAIGGVNMYFPTHLYDANSQLKQYTSGCVHLNGFRALTVVRARHLQYLPFGSTNPYPETWTYEAESDLARIRRNHEFLRVLASAVSKKGIGDPITDANLISAVAPQLTVDSGLTTSHMADLILNFHGVNAQTAPQLTLPVMVLGQPYVYKGYGYGDVVFPDNTPDLATIQQFLGVGPLTNTMTGEPLPKPSQVTVNILNGTGVANQAADTAAALSALGYKIGGTGDTAPVGNPALTTVEYNSTDPAVVAGAERVLRSITGQAVLAYEPTQTAAITVVTGTDFSVLPPAPAPVTTTTAHAPSTKSATATTTTTIAPTTTTTVPGFQATTAASSPLSPWDPRSCTANGGEGP